MSEILAYTKAVGYQVTIGGVKEVGQSFREIGFVEASAKLTTAEGIEKVTKFILSILSLLSKESQQVLKPFKTVMNQTNRVCYATMIFKSLADFKNAKLDNLASTVILAIGAFADAIYFVVKEAKLVSTQVFSNVSNQLGQFRIFKLPVVSSLLTKPKDFFVWLGSGVSLIEEIVVTVKEIRKARRNAAELAERLNKKEYFKEEKLFPKNLEMVVHASAETEKAVREGEIQDTEDDKNAAKKRIMMRIATIDTLKYRLRPKIILKAIGNIGKMLLIPFGAAFGDKDWFKGVNVTTQTSGLFSLYAR